MFSYEAEDRLVNDRKETCRDQWFNLLLDQAIQPKEQRVDLNNLEGM